MTLSTWYCACIGQRRRRPPFFPPAKGHGSRQPSFRPLSRGSHAGARIPMPSANRINFKRDIFVILVGYIDESYSKESPPLTFGLSCLLAYGNEWPCIELAWRKVLENKNRGLLDVGRQP